MYQKEIFMLYPKLAQLGFQKFLLNSHFCNRKYCGLFIYVLTWKDFWQPSFFFFSSFLNSYYVPGVAVFAAALLGKYFALVIILRRGK